MCCDEDLWYRRIKLVWWWEVYFNTFPELNNLFSRYGKYSKILALKWYSITTRTFQEIFILYRTNFRKIVCQYLILLWCITWSSLPLFTVLADDSGSSNQPNDDASSFNSLTARHYLPLSSCEWVLQAWTFLYPLRMCHKTKLWWREVNHSS